MLEACHRLSDHWIDIKGGKWKGEAEEAVEVKDESLAVIVADLNITNEVILVDVLFFVEGSVLLLDKKASLETLL